MITTPTITARLDSCFLLRRGDRRGSDDLAPVTGITRHLYAARGVGSGLLAIAVALFCAACGSSPVVLTAFRTEQQAQEHCPKDTVWLDPQNGLFELKGHGMYGLSGTGRYACRGDAERAGMHAVPN
jgi:hypothetical protein